MDTSTDVRVSREIISNLQSSLFIIENRHVIVEKLTVSLGREKHNSGHLREKQLLIPPKKKHEIPFKLTLSDNRLWNLDGMKRLISFFRYTQIEPFSIPAYISTQSGLHGDFIAVANKRFQFVEPSKDHFITISVAVQETEFMLLIGKGPNLSAIYGSSCMTDF